jgi:hypothetical protein
MADVGSHASSMSNRTTAIAPDQSTRAWLWLGFPVLGIAILWLIKSLAGWAAGLEWVPFQGPLRLVASIPEPQVTIASVAAGLIAGLVVAGYTDAELLRLTVADDVVVVGTGDAARRVARAATTAVFLDGSQLVLLGRSTEELARTASDIDSGMADRLRAAFRAHGWPWHDVGDPHRDAYRRWVEDTPDISPAGNAIFRARARALSRGDKDDAAQLRGELGRLAIVVRDECSRQYWRPTRDFFDDGVRGGT